MYKEHPLFKQYYDCIKKRIVFPEILPAIYNITVADNYMYASTYSTDSLNTQMYVLDLNGKLIDIKSVPIKWSSATKTYPYTISNGYLYQLVINESKNWGVKVVKIY